MINIDGNDFDQIEAAFKEASRYKGTCQLRLLQRRSKEKAYPSWKTRPDGMEKLLTMSSMHMAMEDLEKVGEALCQK